MAKNIGATESSTAPTGAFTKWEAFDKANLVPTSITCDGYLPVHNPNIGCHSKTLLNAPAILSHLTNDHGGGFVFQLRVSDGKKWSGWNAFKEAGVEITDIRCDVCDRQIPLHPQHLLACMKAHSGKSRKVRSGGVYNITISANKPLPQNEDAFEFDE